MAHASGEFAAQPNAVPRVDELLPVGVAVIARTAWPIVISMLSYTAMGVVDTLFVGGLGTAELAGVSIAATAMMLVSALALGGLQSVKVVVSQATGAGLLGRARQAGWQGLWMALSLGACVALLALLAARFCGVMGASGEVLEHATAYFGIRCLAAPGWFALTALCEYRQGRGDTRSSMRYNLLANGLNCVLDPILIVGWGPIDAMGVGGAALATLLAQSLAAVAICASFVHEVGRPMPPDRDALTRLARVGLPLGMNWLLDVGVWSILVAMLARINAAEVAANMVAIRVVSVSFLPGHGIGQAASILVGRCVGAEQPGVASSVVRSALFVACAVMGAMAFVFVSAPEPIVSLFTDDPEVIAIASALLVYAAGFQVVDAVTMTLQGALNGAGDTAFTMKVGIVAGWGVLLPLGWLLGVRLGMGSAGVWLAIMADITLRSIAVTARWRSGAWRGRRVV